MLRTDRICVGIFIFGFLFLIPSIWYIKFIDELCAALYGGLALLDCVANGNFRRYRLLWMVLAVFSAYAIYSMTCVHFNSPLYVLMDLVIEMKSYVSFLVVMAVNPKFTDDDKALLRKIAIVNSSIIALSFLGGYKLVELVVFHVAFAGIVIFVSMLFYIYASIDKDGQLSKRNLYTVCFFLLVGIACTRSKYYGEVVLLLFFLFLYKPMMLKKISAKQVCVVGATMLLVFIVSWKKIQYYFLTGEAQTFDPSEVATFARPVLYATGALILVDYFPFGSGLASFATYPSQVSYSGIYYEYGINNVFGLSPQRPDFICDAFYPSLAQFGFVGLILFVSLWVYIYHYLKIFIRTNPNKYKYEFVVGVMSMCFILIESIAGTAFTLSCGVLIMALLGFLCSQAKELRQSQQCEAVVKKEKSLKIL